MRPVIKSIIQSINDKPESWRFNCFNSEIIYSKNENITIWTGPFFLGMTKVIEPCQMYLRPWEWLELRKAVGRLRQFHIAQKLNPND